MSYETYTTVDWLMFFYIYCFLGWCFESTYVSHSAQEMGQPRLYARTVSSPLRFRSRHYAVS